jgi:ABC-type glycerol-3-phosphate transport system permease component
MMNAFKNTFRAIAINCITLPMAIIVAYTFFKKIPFERFFRVAFYLPSMVSIVVLTLAFRYMFNSSESTFVGPAAELLNRMGIAFAGWDTLEHPNTVWALILPGLFSTYYVLLLRNFFYGINGSLEEAAQLDGASELKIMLKIALTLVASSFGLIFLLLFIGYWNDYQTLLLYAPSHPSVAYGLFRVMTDSTGASERGSTPVQMAGCILIVIPVFTLFIIFRNKLMGNLTIGGVKE